MLKPFILAAAAAAAGATPAFAGGPLSEVRLGVAAHDLTEPAEDGPQIVAEALFDSPGFLQPLGAPRPYVAGSFNTQSFTNLGSAGLAWNIRPVERLRLEASFGVTYHDGVTDIPEGSAPDDPDRIRIAETRALLGSHWLFRSQFAADFALSDRLHAGVFYEHYSHGQILGSGRNQGLDEVGVRLTYAFR